MTISEDIENAVIQRYRYFASKFKYENLSFPYEFFKTNERPGGGPHFEYTEEKSFLLIHSERGGTKTLCESNDLDDIMFYLFSRRVVSEAMQLTQSIKIGKDPRRIWYPVAVELMRDYYPDWVDRLEQHFSEILNRRPFKD